MQNLTAKDVQDALESNLKCDALDTLSDEETTNAENYEQLNNKTNDSDSKYSKMENQYTFELIEWQTKSFFFCFLSQERSVHV